MLADEIVRSSKTPPANEGEHRPVRRLFTHLSTKNVDELRAFFARPVKDLNVPCPWCRPLQVSYKSLNALEQHFDRDCRQQQPQEPLQRREAAYAYQAADTFGEQ
jgi:hypothetical protein